MPGVLGRKEVGVISRAALISQDAAEAIEISDDLAFATVPSVTVFMMTYNHAAFLAQSIESVIAQTREFPIEILIGEDCSTDETRVIAESFQRRYPSIIRIITGPRNVGHMRNYFRMLPKIRGEYVALLEGDDWWTDPRKLEKQFGILQRDKGISMCFHAASVFNEATKKYAEKRHFAKRTKVLDIEQVVTGRGGMIPTASIFLRRSALPPMEDWHINSPVGDLPIQIWATLQGICLYYPEVMSTYRIGAPQQWTSQSKDLASLWAVRKVLIGLLLTIAKELGGPAGNQSLDRAVRKRIGDVVKSTLIANKKGRGEALDDISDYLKFLSLFDRGAILLENFPWISRQTRRIKKRLVRSVGGGGSFLAT